jgi:hypothetical protein
MHGFLWVLHKSHHEPRKGAFELNDLFGFIFAPSPRHLKKELQWLAPLREHQQDRLDAKRS